VGSEEGLPKDLVDFLKEKQNILNFPASDRFSIVAINY
jgi:hypothetical protein